MRAGDPTGRPSATPRRTGCRTRPLARRSNGRMTGRNERRRLKRLLVRPPTDTGHRREVSIRPGGQHPPGVSASRRIPAARGIPAAAGRIPGRLMPTGLAIRGDRPVGNGYQDRYGPGGGYGPDRPGKRTPAPILVTDRPTTATPPGNGYGPGLGPGPGPGGYGPAPGYGSWLWSGRLRSRRLRPGGIRTRGLTATAMVAAMVRLQAPGQYGSAPVIEAMGRPPPGYQPGANGYGAATRWLRLRTSAGITVATVYQPRPWLRPTRLPGRLPVATLAMAEAGQAGPVQVPVPVPVPTGRVPPGWGRTAMGRRPGGPSAGLRARRSDDPWRVPVRGALPAGAPVSRRVLRRPAGWNPRLGRRTVSVSPRYEGDVRPGEPARSPAPPASKPTGRLSPVGPPPALPAGPSARRAS